MNGSTPGGAEGVWSWWVGRLVTLIEGSATFPADNPPAFLFLIALPLLLLAIFRIFPKIDLLLFLLVLALASVVGSTVGGMRVTAMVFTVAVLGLFSYFRFDRIPDALVRWAARRSCPGDERFVLPVAYVGEAPGVLLLDAGFLTLVVLDLFFLPSPGKLKVRRETLRVASLQQRHDVTLVLVNESRFRMQLELVDDLDEKLEPIPEEFDVRIAGRTRMSFDYVIIPHRRGAYTLNCVHLRFRSRLGFWWRYAKPAVESVLHVYPDMKQLSEYAILARTNRLSLMGVKRTRRIGQDNEFERLRDYSLDDNFRHIDWRATARNKLTVKDFQTNQSQRLIFMIDCGRMMTNEANGISLLDYAINSMLMAAYVALRQGDSVGLICFSDRVHTYVPPRGGMKHMNQLLHSVFDRHPEMVESRYDDAFLYLSTHCRKRSLVVMITNLIDEVNSIQVEQYLANLVGHHLPLGVLLRDHRLFDAADRRPRRSAEAYEAAVAAEILNWRHQLLVDLTHRGVLALDVFPEDMTAPLVNQYLQIKARHLL